MITLPLSVGTREPDCPTTDIEIAMIRTMFAAKRGDALPPLPAPAMPPTLVRKPTGRERRLRAMLEGRARCCARCGEPGHYSSTCHRLTLYQGKRLSATGR